MSVEAVSSPAHLHHHRLRFGDLDWQGHVNNVRYVDYLQEAHFTLLDPGQERLYRPSSATFVVASHSVNYLRPLTWRDDTIQVVTRVSALGRSKVGLESVIHDGEHEYALANCVYVAYDLPAHRSRPLSAPERAHLGQYMTQRVELAAS